MDHAVLGPSAAYWLGAAQLAARDPCGIQTLEDCIRRAPALAAPARRLLHEHRELLPGPRERKRNDVLWQRARKRRAAAAVPLHHALAAGSLPPAKLPEPVRDMLSEVLAGCPWVAGAWCLAGEGAEPGGRHYDATVLVLRLRADALESANWTEEDAIAEAQALLRDSLPPDRLGIVWTAYTTEPLTAELDACLARTAQENDPACLVQPASGESVGPGVRASALG
jgi:hypothetical protein